MSNKARFRTLGRNESRIGRLKGLRAHLLFRHRKLSFISGVAARALLALETLPVTLAMRSGL